MIIKISDIKIGSRIRKSVGDLINLKESITKLGLLQPIIIDKQHNLICGQRRLIAHKELNKKEIEAIVVDSLTDALKIEAERDENTCRLNFTAEEIFEQGKEIELVVAKESKEREVLGKPTLRKSSLGSGQTRDIVAKSFGISGKQYDKIKEIGNKDKAKLKEIDDGMGLSINKAHNIIKQEKRKADITKLKNDIKSGKCKLPEGTYEVIVIDPPWAYDDDNNYDPNGRRASNPYPTMDINKIKSIKIPASKDCILWLWTTHHHLKYAFDILNTWGFEDKVILTWIKSKLGLGTWLRSKSEFCIMAVKGNPKVNLTNQTTILEGKSKGHSSKPDEFYKMVEELCIGRRLDYFSRCKRSGWDTFGTMENLEEDA